MSKKEEILQMYFEEHKKQEIIAETIGVSQSYISQVVKKDTRYTKEKEIRHNKSMQKKAEYNREYYKNYERPKKDDNSYEQLKALLNKDNAELSFHNNTISDYDFAKWNLSAYHRNKKGNLIIDRKLNVTNDVPKKINMNMKLKSQKCLI